MIRALLVLAVLAGFALALWAMRRGWRNRMARQSALPAPPEVPGDLGPRVVADASGLYVGTTYSTSWQDRVVAHGLGAPAAATASVHPSGVFIEREGARPLFIPAAAVIGARLAPALAGKVVGEGGLLVICWTWGGAELDTGFRADDKDIYPAWVRAVAALPSQGNQATREAS